MEINASALIKENFNSKPIYYWNYHKVLSGERFPEFIVKPSQQQSISS